MKRKERDEEKTLNKKVKKVNKILKEHFNDGEIPDTVVKPVLKKKSEKKEEIKEEYVQETKKKYIKRNTPLQRIRLEIHNDDSSSDDSSSEEELYQLKKIKKFHSKKKKKN